MDLFSEYPNIANLKLSVYKFHQLEGSYVDAKELEVLLSKATNVKSVNKDFWTSTLQNPKFTHEALVIGIKEIKKQSLQDKISFLLSNINISERQTLVEIRKLIENEPKTETK